MESGLITAHWSPVGVVSAHPCIGGRRKEPNLAPASLEAQRIGIDRAPMLSLRLCA